MHGALQDRVGRLGVHGVEHAMDRLVAARAQKGSAQDLLRLGIDEDLHETVGLALFEGAGDVLHGNAAHERAAAAAAHLGLGHAGAAERRVGIERIGGDAVTDLPVFAVEQVGCHDLEVIVGGMGEGAPSVAVAQRPDARHVG